MKESLLKFQNKNFDGINFYRNEDGDVEVNGFLYKEPGEQIGGTELGDWYDIIIMSDEPLMRPERFKGILVSPIHYVSRMIDDGFLGVVAKVTTTSEPLVDFLFNEFERDMDELFDEYEKEMKNA